MVIALAGVDGIGLRGIDDREETEEKHPETGRDIKQPPAKTGAAGGCEQAEITQEDGYIGTPSEAEG